MIKTELKNWETAASPMLVVLEAISRFETDCVETGEDAREASVYVNQAMARAMIVDMMMHHGLEPDPEQVDKPKHFAFNDRFVFVNDKLFPSDEGRSVYYVGVLRRPLVNG